MNCEWGSSFKRNKLGVHKIRCKSLDLISPSTINRVLKPYKKPHQRGLSTTRSGLMKNKIPLKLPDGEVTILGYMEADTVAH